MNSYRLNIHNIRGSDTWNGVQDRKKKQVRKFLEEFQQEEK